MIRPILAVVLGLIVWILGFDVLAIALSKLWPEYASEAQHWMRDGVFSMTAAMACCTLLFWMIAEAAAGATAALIAKKDAAPRVLAGIIGLYLIAMHFILFWARFPWWYNLGVVCSSVPAVIFGGWLARKTREADRQSM
jgi:hypothetical protein